MARNARADGIELEENLPFQRRMWLVQRVGWAGIAALLLVAGAGLLGPSWLTRRVVRRGTAEVAYHRVGRMHSPQQVRLVVRSADSAPLMVRIDGALVRALNIQRIEPEPSAASSDAATLVLAFQRSSTTAVTLYCRPDRSGWARGGIQVDDGPRLELTQFVLP